MFFLFVEDTNCTIDGLSTLDPKMPSYLFIAAQTSFVSLERAAVLCTGQKLLGGPVNSTFEDGNFFLECSTANKSWTQPPLWPNPENCIVSNQTCLGSEIPAPPGISITLKVQNI